MHIEYTFTGYYGESLAKAAVIHTRDAWALLFWDCGLGGYVDKLCCFD
jgi:hypothetical protein